MPDNQAITGCLLGGAVGDAIGLPYEGLSARRIKKCGVIPLNQRLLFGRGMISDDSEHSCMVAQALIASAGNPQLFCSQLGWRMRWWVAALPAAIGLGTLRACAKLCLGFSARSSGVFTAGNGPMMRSAIIGVYAAHDITLMQQLVSISTRITHSDPKAEKAAFIIAWLASLASRSKPVTAHQLQYELCHYIQIDDELNKQIKAAIASASNYETAMEFCQHNGMSKGVSAYCYASLPVVLQVCLRLPDQFEQAMTEIILCGGDTDTVAAITGGIIGARVGLDGLPVHWLKNLTDWPRSTGWISCLGNILALNTKQPQTPPFIFYPFALLRNLLFMLLILLLGFRRLLPPY